MDTLKSKPLCFNYFLGAGFCEKSRQDKFRTILHLIISIWVTLYHIYSMRI